jgi:signal peptidase I
MKVIEQNTKKKKDQPAKKDGFQVTLEYIKSFLIALLLALLIKATIIEAYKIPTPSMEKTLLAGDFILGNKFIYGINIPFTKIHLPAFREPKHGDIIIFHPPHSPHENYVKRCIGLPGDTIQLVHKRVYVNGKLYEDQAFTQYITNYDIPRDQRIGDPYDEARLKYGITNIGHRPYAPFRDNSYPIVVPPGKYFMMGDNRDNSLDSRMWGFVDRNQIMGKALLIHWSWKLDDPNAPSVDWRNPLTVVSNLAYNFIHFPERVNWDRLGTVPK